MVRNLACGVHLRDISGNVMLVGWEVGLVCAIGVLIPFAREDALAADFFKRNPNSPDPGEEVNEGELVVGRPARLAARVDDVAERRGLQLRVLALVLLPSANSGFIHSKQF